MRGNPDTILQAKIGSQLLNINNCTSIIYSGGPPETDLLPSRGGVQHSSKQLEDFDLIERKGNPEQWQLVDPVLAMWLKGTG